MKTGLDLLAGLALFAVALIAAFVWLTLFGNPPA